MPHPQVDTQVRWQAHRTAAALEHTSLWLPKTHTQQSSPSPSQQPAHALTLPSTEQAAGAETSGGGGRSKRRRKQSLTEQQQQQQQSQQSVASTDLQLPEPRGFVNVCGVDLPRRMGSNTAASGLNTSSKGGAEGVGCVPADEHAFVSTPTVTRNLRAAALALCADRPLLLEGPPGCGKTRLVQQLADVTHNTGSMVCVCV